MKIEIAIPRWRFDVPLEDAKEMGISQSHKNEKTVRRRVEAVRDTRPRSKCADTAKSERSCVRSFSTKSKSYVPFQVLRRIYPSVSPCSSFSLYYVVDNNHCLLHQAYWQDNEELSWECPGHVPDMSWTCPFVLGFGYKCYSSRTLSDMTLVSPMSSWSPAIWVMSNLIAAKVKCIEPNANILRSNVSVPFLNAFR